VPNLLSESTSRADRVSNEPFKTGPCRAGTRIEEIIVGNVIRNVFRYRFAYGIFSGALGIISVISYTWLRDNHKLLSQYVAIDWNVRQKYFKLHARRVQQPIFSSVSFL